MIQNSTNGRNLSIMVHNGPRWSKMVQNGPKWYKMVQNGPKWSKMYQNVSRRFEMNQMNRWLSVMIFISHLNKSILAFVLFSPWKIRTVQIKGTLWQGYLMKQSACVLGCYESIIGRDKVFRIPDLGSPQYLDMTQHQLKPEPILLTPQFVYILLVSYNKTQNRPSDPAFYHPIKENHWFLK